ncbi:MAG TPA: Na(+)/H(+) antiporter subunit D, partial [Candidatus Competibacteraceae bacterium]|nr:Na(+)/H(+) antiporter subunit D [Candidatus Competibacteraceae bacterium]
IYPPELRSVNLDFDWTYRKLLPAVTVRVWGGLDQAWQCLTDTVERQVKAVIQFLSLHHGLHGQLAVTWPTGSMVLWAVLLLGACLVFYYV